MRTCMFCATPLTGINRAKEHVLRNSWLKHLGHQKHPIAMGLFSKHGHRNTRYLVADQLQTGEVCGTCNGGWMNHLDREVEAIVLGLAQKSIVASDISRENLRNLGRWLVKTACTFIYTDESSRRHINKNVLRSLRRRDYLPAGFFMFHAVTQTESKGVGLASIDIWPISESNEILELPQSTRMKFGLHYDNVMLGFACISGKAKPIFTAIEGFHEPLLISRAGYMLEPPSQEFLCGAFSLPPEVDRTPLNIWLSLLAAQAKRDFCE